MIKYFIDWIFEHRRLVERVRDSIVDYEYDKTQENLTKIVKETYRLARYYKDFHYDGHDRALGEFLFQLQHNTGPELTMSLYHYQVWLNERQRSKCVYNIKKWLVTAIAKVRAVFGF